VDIKRAIKNAIKDRTDCKVQVALWHGQTHDYHRAIYNEVLVFNKYYQLIDMENALYFGDDMNDTDDNVKILLKQRDEMYKYLDKHFSDVEAIELSI
jgi:hypothetical protein